MGLGRSVSVPHTPWERLSPVCKPFAPLLPLVHTLYSTKPQHTLPCTSPDLLHPGPSPRGSPSQRVPRVPALPGRLTPAGPAGGGPWWPVVARGRGTRRSSHVFPPEGAKMPRMVATARSRPPIIVASGRRATPQPCEAKRGLSPLRVACKETPFQLPHTPGRKPVCLSLCEPAGGSQPLFWGSYPTASTFRQTSCPCSELEGGCVCKQRVQQQRGGSPHPGVALNRLSDKWVSRSSNHHPALCPNPELGQRKSALITS